MWCILYLPTLDKDAMDNEDRRWRFNSQQMLNGNNFYMVPSLS